MPSSRRRLPLAALVAWAGLLCGPARAAAAVEGRVVPALDAAAIDRMIAAEWGRHGLMPTPPVDDAGFLRRAYLDISGIVPPPEAVTAFLADRRPDKRARLVATLLDGPRYAEHFTDYWEAVLFGRTARRGDIDRGAFREWWKERLQKNLGWDRLVRELVTASGMNTGPAEPEHPVNGAVNFALLYDRNPQDLAGTVSREFLGVQIQCAQCHNHPTEKWKQEDFLRFAASLSRLRAAPVDPQRPGAVRRLELKEGDRPIGGSMELAAIGKGRPTALDGTDLGAGASPRQELAEWMTAPGNPWFARELVNRYWAYFVGRGFAEPIDDLRPSNPATLPALLDLLAQDFAAHGHDLKRLIRLLCSTRAYQLSSAVVYGKGKDPEGRYFARYPLRPLGPVELLDSVVAVTGLADTLRRAAPAPQDDRLERIRAQLRQAVTFVFDLDEELSPPDFQGTVQQALMLMNGSLLNTGVGTLPGSALLRLLLGPGGDREKIEALYLRVLSRRPSAQESAHWLEYVNGAREATRELPEAARDKDRKTPAPGKARMAPDPLRGLQDRLRPVDAAPRLQAFEDLFWALLNSSEFIFRH